MQNILFCSLTHLRIISGGARGNRITVKKFAEIPLPEGGVSGGLIADTNIMIGFFTEVAKSYGLDKGNTSLVIDNNLVRIKKMRVPSLKRTDIIETIKEDYTASGERTGGKVYDYAVTEEKNDDGGYTVLAAVTERAMLDTFLHVADGADLNLRRIDIGANCRAKAERIDINEDVRLSGEAEDVGGFDVLKYLPNIGALLNAGFRRKDIDLLHANEGVRSKPPRRVKRFRARAALISVAALIVLSFGGFYWTQMARLQDEKTSSLAYLQDVGVQADYDKAKAAMKTAADANEVVKILEDATKNIESYPEMTPDQLKQIQSVAAIQKTELSSIEFDKNTGILTLSCASQSATQVPIFISSLRSSGLFKDITYDGYTSATAGKTVKYTFTARASIDIPQSPVGEDASEEGEADA
jgi:Tfp pilus assembly protein PilN